MPETDSTWRSRRPRRAIVPLIASSLGLILVTAACGGTAETPEAAGATQGLKCGKGKTMDQVVKELAKLPYDERMDLVKKKAAKEGVVMAYTSSDLDQQAASTEIFEEEYPDVTLSFIRTKSEDTTERLGLEARAGRHIADVLDVNSTTGLEMRKAGLIADHKEVAIPPGFPKDYYSDWNVMDTISPNLIVWNTDLVPSAEAPKELDDLLDPKWKGKVVVAKSPETFISGLIVSRGLDGAKDYLQKLMVDNEAIIGDSHSTILESIGSGEFEIGAEEYAHNIVELQEDGAPVDWSAPDPTPANASGYSLYKCAPHPYAAILLMNFLIDTKGAQSTADTGRVTVNPNVKLPTPTLQPFLEEGSDLNERLLPITPEIAEETNEDVYKLIQEFFSF